MIMKKLISAIASLSIAATAFASLTVVEAASLGGKPVVKAEFVEYTTNTSKSWAKAWVKVTVDLSAAEDLTVYESGTVYDEEEEDDVVVRTGNGISTLGITLSTDCSDFAAQATNLEMPSSWGTPTVTGSEYAIAFMNSDIPTLYSEEVTELLLNFKVTSANFDKSANLSFSNIGIAGICTDVYNVTNNTSEWSYSLATSNVTGCSIPSYNEWSTPAGDPDDTIINGTVQNDTELGETATPFYINSTITANAKPYWYANITKGGETKQYKKAADVAANMAGSGKVKLGLVYVGSETISNVSLKWE